MKLNLLILILLFSIVAPARGQSVLSSDTVTTDQRSTAGELTIESRTVPVIVYDDTLLIGTTPIVRRSLDTGRHVLRYYSSGTQSWFNPPLLDTVVVESLSVIHRMVIPSFMFRITSEPYGATVFHGDSLMGTTPLILTTTDTMGIVTVLKENYQKTEVLYSVSHPSPHIILLPLPGAAVSPFEPLVRESPGKHLPIYLTTAATVISGVAAAYLKMKADSYYDDYRLTGSRSALDRLHAYDTAAGIALAASEISFFTLTIVLFTHRGDP